MIPCLPCEAARELLEPLIDRELSTAEQVAADAHLRTCATCRARVEDLFLIGWSLRSGTPSTCAVESDVRALTVVQSGVLERLRAERAQSWRVRLPELLSDMRLWWPALGATIAVLMCLWGSTSVWRFTMEKHPHSLAAALDPGSNSNPLPLDDRISLPRVQDQPLVPEGVSADDGAYMVMAVVTQAGSVDDIELVRMWHAILPESARARALSSRQAGGQALLEAMRGSRFTPAQNADGRTVAVLLVVLIERTTITATWRPLDEIPRSQRLPRTVAPKATPSQTSEGVRSAVEQGSLIA